MMIQKNRTFAFLAVTAALVLAACANQMEPAKQGGEKIAQYRERDSKAAAPARVQRVRSPTQLRLPCKVRKEHGVRF